jgi:hypothetical protein
MKRALLGLMLSLVTYASAQADIITQWDFNFLDGSGTTGTNAPAIGSGSLTNIGTTTSSFGSQGANTTDPYLGDNSALRLATFPAATAGNKTSGIQFLASTVGYENIKVTWDHDNSASASKYWRVQYTTDGTTWIDNIVVLSAGSTAWQLGVVADFSTIPGVKNNPNFGFRLVSEFESTATGSGTAGYVGNAGNYSTAGTLWVDMVTLTGTPVDTSNTDPTISTIADQTIHPNQSLGPISFTVGDVETPANQLSVSASSSNPTLIQNITLGGTAANRTISMVPEANQSGLAMITVTVTDAGGKASSSSFNVLVRAPSLVVSNESIRVNAARTVNVQIDGIESFQNPVTLSADSSNPTLLPISNITFGGSGSNRTMTLTPVAGQVGGALVALTATDNSLTATSSMFLTVVSSNTIALWNFNSKVRDNNASTGDIDPAFGAGTATSCGTATNSLNSNVSAASSDPDTGDNAKWRFGSFPVNGEGNKTSGAEFHVSTVGYQNISVNWDHYNSATGSRYWRLQYSLDGSTFIDSDFVYTNPAVTTWAPAGFNLGNIPGINNNPNFAIRIVSEFESTATGAGADSYIGTQATGGYGTGGTLWLDMVSFTGDTFVPSANPTTLKVSYTGTSVQISWPANVTGSLESTASLTAPNWQVVSQTPTVVGANNVITISNQTDSKFFRLHQQ